VSPVRYELGFYIPEDAIFHSHCREHLKSYKDMSNQILYLVLCPETATGVNRKSYFVCGAECIQGNRTRLPSRQLSNTRDCRAVLLFLNYGETATLGPGHANNFKINLRP
jgi:hypothetical protein